MSNAVNQSQSVLGEMKPSRAIIKLAVGVTLPLLLIMVSVENIFAAGAAVLAGRQLGAEDHDGASHTVTTITGLSIFIGIALCLGGIVFIEPLLRAFGASDASLPLARDYAFWMFIAALANLPAQSMNCAARAESSVKISSVAVITGALLNVLLGPVFMFDWDQLLLISQVALYPAFGLTGIALSQPAADLLTLAVCLLSVRPMKRIASQNMSNPT